ncbi:hypothetical protein FQA39_LY04517 [Lamprigera yunnana]|nr:hypothetical protein FQA39_LY04517 [Lamprigera yunnana]
MIMLDNNIIRLLLGEDFRKSFKVALWYLSVKIANVVSWIKPYRELTLESETVFYKPCGKSFSVLKTGRSDQPENAVSNVLVDYLQGHRFTAASTRRNIKRQRLNVEPRKSVTAANNDKDSSDSDVPTRTLTNDDLDDDHTEAAVEETQG